MVKLRKRNGVVKGRGKMDEMKLQEGADGGFLSRNSELELLQWGLSLHLRLFLSVLFVGL